MCKKQQYLKFRFSIIQNFDQGLRFLHNPPRCVENEGPPQNHLETAGLLDTKGVGINPPSPSDNWHGYLMSWNGAFWWRSLKTWLWTLYSKGWFRRKRRRRPRSKFCIIENRQGPCCFLHSFSVSKSLKAVSSRFQVILRGVFVFYTPGGIV